MLFTINDLGFSIAGLLLEGWLAFAARCVCALALLFIGWVVSRWMQKSLFPRLLKRSWHFAFTHPLLESFARPMARIAWYTGMYLALRSLPWAIPDLAALLLKAYRMMLVFLIGTGFYHASGIAALLLASSSEEVRTNRTLLTLLDKVYKVAVVVLCGATIAQESGFPIGDLSGRTGYGQEFLQRRGHPAGQTLLHRRLDHRRRRGGRSGGHQLPLHESPGRG